MKSEFEKRFLEERRPVNYLQFFGAMVANFFMKFGHMTDSLRRIFGTMSPTQQDDVLEAMNNEFTKERSLKV